MSIKSFFAFFAGAAAGAATAYFLSSEKTAETRSKVIKIAEEKLAPVKDKVRDGLSKAEEALGKL
ncbi:MAG: hypothetical protein OSJ55_06215 [Bacteroidales bacterium]|nr:hypothetical protein [Bacteroidales bacterium]